ncbi:MAG: cyclic nucleotide-binding domain-containing protein [Betaproteobacteria bacterium]|nr:cyclic nucleotide-binding domain-containing protein [Betaproteobacteria bacterium]
MQSQVLPYAVPAAQMPAKNMAELDSRIFTPTDALPAPEFSVLPPAWRGLGSVNITTGLVASIVSLPMSMGLGILAFAPLGPEYVSTGLIAGLYAAAFLGLVAVLFGARGVAIYAPRSLVAFMVAAVATEVAAPNYWPALRAGDPMLLPCALLLILAMAGVIQMLLGFARLGRMVKFIPAPVMAGFQNAAGFIVLYSQLYLFFGLEAKPAMLEWVAALAQMKPLTLAVGIVSLALIFHGSRISRRVPPQVVGLLGGTLLYYLLLLLGMGDGLGATIGDIPFLIPDGRYFGGVIAVTALPGFGDILPSMLIAALSLAIVSSLDILVSAKVVETLSGMRGNSTHELIKIGAANAITPLLGGVAGSISLATTTANIKAGASNSLSLLAHAVTFLVLMPVLIPVLGYIPKVVIAAVIVHAGYLLFDRWSLLLLKKILARETVHWGLIALDLAVIAVVTVIAITGEIPIAVGLGILVSVAVFTQRMSRGVVRGVQSGTHLRSRRTRDESDVALLAEHGGKIILMELEGPLFFASAELVVNRIDSAAFDGARYIIIDISHVNEIDSTGARLLSQAHQRMRAVAGFLAFSGEFANPRMTSTLRDHGLLDLITRDRYFPDNDRALEWAENQILVQLRDEHSSATEENLGNFGITSGFTEAELGLLRANLERRSYAAGDVVCRQGDPGDSVFVILRGSASVRLCLKDTEGEALRDRRLVTFSAGTVFGEMALLDRGERSATVLADEDLVCLSLSRVQYDALASEHPEVALKLLANLGRELSLRIRLLNQSLLSQQ